MEKRVLIWDDGLNYVNYMEALRAVDLTPVVGREAAGRALRCCFPAVGISRIGCRRMRSGRSEPMRQRRSRFWVSAGECRR